MGRRILCVGIDPDLLTTPQALLAYRGYDPVIATPEDVDEKLRFGTFDLAILSVMLSPEDKLVVRSKLPAGTRVLALETIVWPEELLKLVAKALSR
jgi:DNA-binding response OmpR family regulator